MMESKPCARTKVFSISTKPRAAIGTSNKLGKAIWFDEKSGLMTSSKYYFPEGLDEWLVNFNNRHGVDKIQSFCWDYMYNKDGDYYHFDTIDQFENIKQVPGIIGEEIAIDRTSKHALRGI